MSDDDALMTLVREHLDTRAASFEAPPTSWDRIERGLLGVRRRRRLRAAAVAVVASVAVGALGLGLRPSGPDLSTPAVPDGAVRPVLTGATVGSLAADEAFLADVRRAVADLPTTGEAALPGDRTPSEVAVPFAGDVGDVRVVLVETTVGTSGGPLREHLWFQGDRGASVRALLAGGRTEQPAQTPAFTWATLPTDLSREGTTGALVVVTASDRGDLQLATGPSYAKDGTVGWRVRTVPRASRRHWEVALPSGGAEAGTFARVPGGSQWFGLSGPDMLVGDPGTLLDGVLPPVHGAAAPDDVRLGRAVAAAQEVAVLPVASSARRLVWTGTVGGRPVDVVAVTAPSGARIVSAVSVLADANGGGYDTTWTTAVLPSGPLDELAFAWASPPTQADEQPEVAVVGPDAAVAATVVSADGSRKSTALVDGFGTVRAAQARTVELSALDGTVLATVDVARGRDVVRPPAP